jgi:demethylspheroidene O-methyltransferase
MNAPMPQNGMGLGAARRVVVEVPAPAEEVEERPSLRAAWLRLRNAVYASPRFQRWAARFPLTRRIANQRAVRVFDLCAGFVYSQVLHAAVQTGLLKTLQRGSGSVQALAVRVGLPLSAAERLLAAAAALDLAEALPNGRYGLGSAGADLLGNPAVLQLIRHHALLYRDLADPVALLCGKTSTELSRFWSYTPEPDAADSVTAYSQLMSDSVGLVAHDVLEAYPFQRHKHLLDVAGGEGGFVEALATRAPRLALSVFDLPAVAVRAEQRLATAGLAGRVRVLSGDMFHDALPTGADLVTLLRVVHDHDDADALRLLQAVARALPRRGRLLLAEPMAGTAGAEAMGAAYFGFYLLAMGRGRPRTEQALRALLREAGFARVRELPTRRPILVRLLLAEH